MPNYSYECQDCHHIFEVRASIQDMEKAVFHCEKCGSQNTRRLFNGFGYYRGDNSGNQRASSCASCLSRSCSSCHQ